MSYQGQIVEGVKATYDTAAKAGPTQRVRVVRESAHQTSVRRPHHLLQLGQKSRNLVADPAFLKSKVSSIDIDLLRQITRRGGFRDLGDTPDLIHQIGSQLVDNARQFTPCAFDVQDESLATQFTKRVFYKGGTKKGTFD